MLYTDEEELSRKITEYFINLDGSFHWEKIPSKSNKTELIDQKVWDRDPEPATISGLAFSLGFESLQELEEYKIAGEFAGQVKRACLKIEAEYEKKLYQQASGIVFALKCMGWKDKENDGASSATIQLLQVIVTEAGPEPASNEHQVILN